MQSPYVGIYIPPGSIVTLCHDKTGLWWEDSSGPHPILIKNTKFILQKFSNPCYVWTAVYYKRCFYTVDVQHTPMVSSFHTYRQRIQSFVETWFSLYIPAQGDGCTFAMKYVPSDTDTYHRLLLFPGMREFSLAPVILQKTPKGLFTGDNRMLYEPFDPCPDGVGIFVYHDGRWNYKGPCQGQKKLSTRKQVQIHRFSVLHRIIA